MKDSHKYIKTRGQIVAHELNKPIEINELSLTNIHKKSTTSSVKDDSQQKDSPKIKYKKLPKTKKIAKTKSIKKQTKISNLPKKLSKKNLKAKSKIAKLSQIKLQNKLKKKKVKKQKSDSQINKKIMKKESKSLKKTTKLMKKRVKLQQSNQVVGSEINNKFVNGTIVRHYKKKKLPKNGIKVEVKQENVPNETIKTENQTLLNGIKEKTKMKNKSKMIETLIHPQIISPINIIAEPPIQVKKKGRPKKIVQQVSIVEMRSPDQDRKLSQFIQNAIKLRKVKNEKQFFQSFSRITQYAQQSWEYGDLGKDLKYMPQREEILKIGMIVARGIRKHIQQQQLLSLTL